MSFIILKLPVWNACLDDKCLAHHYLSITVHKKVIEIIFFGKNIQPHFQNVTIRPMYTAVQTTVGAIV